MTAETAQETSTSQLPHQRFIDTILPKLELIHSSAVQTEKSVLLRHSLLPDEGEQGVTAVITDAAERAHIEFRKVNGILSPDERTTKERHLRLVTTLDIFSRLGMLESDEETLEKFVRQYYEAEAAQQDLTAINRANLLDTYEADPAHRAVDSLGSLMGQSDKNVVLLRRTILVLLDANSIPATPVKS